MSSETQILGVTIIAVAALLFTCRRLIRQLLDDATQGIRAFRDRR
jgi:Sec-independent protein translocase protein TatA